MPQALLDLLASHTSLALAITDADGTLLMMTPALERMLDHLFEPLPECELPARLHLYYEDGCTPLRPEDLPIARARAGEHVIDAVVAARPHREGESIIYMRCNATTLRDDDDQISGAVVLVQDITEEWRLRVREAELRERLVVTVNHELRTPVTKLLGHTELLQEVHGLLPPWAQRSLAATHRAAHDLASLSSTLTQLIDLEAAAHIAPAHVDLVPAMRDIAERHSRARAGREVRVGLHAAPRVTATVDLAVVTRAIEELVANAVTYAPDNTRVDLELRVDRSHIVISVADRGPGIAEEEHTRLMQPFERGNQPGQPVNSRGLGLAFARAAAIAHGGDLYLRQHQPAGLIAEWRASRSSRHHPRPPATSCAT